MEVGSLSLDDIIKKEGIKGGKFGGRKPRRDGGIQKTKRNPKAWDHDKFFESQGLRRSSGGDGARSLSVGGKAVARLSNVPYNVTQEDLDDLFGEYRLSRVALHYDYRGRSLGTAELHGSHGIISKLAREFKDVEIDGRPLTIQIVGEGASSARLLSSSGPRIRRFNNGGRASYTGRRSGGGSKSNDSRKKKLTAEELDAELDSYMATSTN